jgi:uncharacterized delta-60 repeat protein
MKNEKQLWTEIKSWTGRMNSLLYVFMCALFTLAACMALPTATQAAGTHLDRSFFGSGKRNFGFADMTSEDAYAVAIQPDGKIIIAGRTNVNGGWDFAVARLREDGTPDSSFNGNGLLTIDFNGSIDTAYAIAIQPDGKILVVGESLALGGTSNFAVARVTDLGVLDPEFDLDGRTRIDFQGENDAAHGVAIQADGKIVVAGYAGRNSRDWGLVRLSDTGALDESFGNAGRVTTDFNSGNDDASGVVVLPDNKIIVAGTAFLAQGTTDFALVRYTPAGIPDNSFQSGGKMTIDLAGNSSDTVKSLERTADGKLVIGGEAFGSEYPMLALVRCSSEGVLDNTFDGDGKVVVSFNRQGNNYMGGLAVNGSGEIAVAARIDGWSMTSGFNVIRFLNDGKLDSRFGAGGRVNTLFGLGEKVAYDVSFQPDGKIVAVGTVRGYSDIGIARYNSHGIASGSDFDGDGRSEIGVYRPSEGMWYLQDSVTATKKYSRFGLSGDEPVLGDYDGDGKTDTALFRHSNGTWYIENSTGGVTYQPFGLPSDIPVPGDYDGDGKTDIAVYRLSSGHWYLLQSTRGFQTIKYGSDVAYPIPGDYDGDGATDVAVYAAADKTWWIHQSHLGDKVVQFGTNGDLPVPADYDGDGVTDIATFRTDGNWWIQKSETNAISVDRWGFGTDLTAPADFDGDGKADIAVFRPSTGVWYITRGDGTWRWLLWGVDGDVPLVGNLLRALA